ncbi:MAG: tRNA uridine-5-carboxymethylaminomethyl(34) synthesis GTPase MnmE [Bacteroidales bacterium]|nr:tRNA uridine-5-carboxymethylaminomethyl(34) synthesis GTPase MnmE [Bacteroidales bacterium]
MFLDSSICAIASPTGEGAVAIIRISGKNAFPITDKIFSTKQKTELGKLPSHQLVLGEIFDGKSILDEVLVTIYKNPHSYTGENVVEIFCHGAVFIQKRIMELLIQNGATQAKEGEFTLRAFLNNKMDLAQAEAVNDLIQGKTALANRLAIKQLKGTFSKEIATIRQKLIDFVSLIELELDFGEEEVEFADRKKLQETIDEIINFIDNLINSFTLGNVIKNGVSTAIVGEPNVGKSTLLNLLLRDEKAIVSEIPGTTRDVVEDTININGVLFRFMDTAGIRKTTDTIESQGIERTFRSIEKSGLVLLMLNAENGTAKMQETIEALAKTLDPETQLLIVVNKIDKLSQKQLKEKKIFWSKQHFDTIFISAKDKKHLPAIEEKLLEITGINSFTEEQVLVTNTRHYEALIKTKEALTNVKAGMTKNIPEDLLTQDIKQALFHLGEISGEISPDEILRNIFGRFCIGK